MRLFEELHDKHKNLLPCDGTVHYHGKILDRAAADNYFQALLTEIAWEQDQALIFGKLYLTPRKVAWYGDKAFEYTYSRITKQALPWTASLLELKKIVEQESGETYNSCLLNLYHSGEEGMAWHSDGEPDLLRNGAIASMSLGAARKFAFKHKETAQKVELVLDHGSLLMMKGSTQQHWLHRLPPTKRIKEARINLTFRTIVK